MLLIVFPLLFTLIQCPLVPPTNNNRNYPPKVQPTDVSKVESPPAERNGLGSSFFNVRNFPEPTIIVRKNTYHPHEFSTIQAAVNSLRERTGPQVIYVHDGIYREQVYIDYVHPLIIRGRQPRDGEQNFASLTFNLSAKEAKSNQASATLTVVKDDFALYFMNVTNDFGTGTDTQALAINARGFRQGGFITPLEFSSKTRCSRPFAIIFIGYYNCVFRSFQDTVRAYRGIQFFSRSTITGGVDFIFGRDSFAWFEQISIPIRKGSKEVITASGRYLTDINGFFVFNNATIYSDGALPGSAYLGRPWREGARVTFQNSYMSDVVNPNGWLAWKEEDPRTEHALFEERGNSGPGARQELRNFTTPLYFPRLPETILGVDYLEWIDYEYRPVVDIFQAPAMGSNQNPTPPTTRPTAGSGGTSL